MTWPTLTVSAAFGIAPLAIPAGGDWIDITSYVRTLSWHRGRSKELDRTQAGTLDLILRNDDRRFDPLNTAGPYFPNVRPMTQVRVRAVHSAVTYDLFTGYVQDWGPRWGTRPINGVGEAEVVVEAVDGFGVLAMMELRPYSEAVLADEPVGYWKLDEPDRSVAPANLGSLGETGDLTYDPGIGSTLPSPGAAGPFAGGQTATDFPDGPRLLSATGLEEFQITGDLTLEWWGKFDVVNNGCSILIHEETSGNRGAWGLVMSSGGVLSFDYRQAPLEPSRVFATSFSAGAWHHYALTRSQGSLGLYVDGALTETIASGGAPEGLSAVNRVKVGDSFDGQLAHVAIYSKALAAARIAEHAARGYDAFAASDAGAHIGLVLDAIGWPSAQRDVDSGGAQIQETTPTGNVLEWLLRVAEDTDHGLLHMSGENKVRFHSHLNLEGHVTAAASIGDSASETIQYEELAASYDDTNLWTEVVVPREGGAEFVTSDASAVATYGRRSLSRGSTLHATDGEAADLATYLLGLYKGPAIRFDSVAFEAFDSTARWTQALSRDIHYDRLTIVRRPPGGGSAISKDGHVVGVSHAVTPPRSWRAMFELAPADPQTYWILGDATYGVLGSTTRLGY